MKKINTVLIAKYIIKQANKKNIDICITKLQKLLYALEGGLLANDIDVFDTYLSAWLYGPVYPVVFTKINFDDIDRKFDNLDTYEIDNHIKGDFIKYMVDRVLDIFGQFPVSKLSAWAKIEGSPFSKTKTNKVINKSLIKAYFTGINYK